MSNGARKKVLWLGERLPAQLQRVAAILGLDAEQGDIGKALAQLPLLLGVLVSMVRSDEGEAPGQAGRLLRKNILDYGTLLALVSDAQPGAHLRAVDLQSRLIRSPRFPGLRGESIRVADTSEKSLARTLREHNPGLAANPAPQIKIRGKRNGGTLGATDKILLERAFSGFDKIVLDEQTGGRSDESRVWMVEAIRQDMDHEPFVAKAGKLRDLQHEFEVFREYVQHGIAFPFRAPCLESQFVKGGARALLVSMFVPRSQRLDEYLTGARNPELVMASLFNVALSRWRESSHVAELGVPLGRSYVDGQRNAARVQDEYAHPIPPLLPDPATLTADWELAKRWDQSLPDPETLWNRLGNTGETRIRKCMAHGDLNVRNIFVRWNSLDVVLIDFSHAGQVDAMARDPAKLETSIALTVKKRRGHLLALKALKQLYRAPLIPPQKLRDGEDPRIRAILQIRRIAAGEGINNSEYELLTACYLLKYASDKKGERADPRLAPRRAMCYMLACRLILGQAS